MDLTNCCRQSNNWCPPQLLLDSNLLFASRLPASDLIVKLLTHAYELPLRHTFTISRESTSVQQTLIVELTDGELSGFGEATTNSYYGMTLENMRTGLEDVRAIVESQEGLDPPAMWEAVAPRTARLSLRPVCPLDQAAYDLWGKQQGKPVYELWGLNTASIPDSNFTIGIDTIEMMVTKLQEMPDWPIYKIKLGTDARHGNRSRTA